jgi:shikimate kinase
MQIFILGYMCSGKTTLGRELAAKLQYGFHDLDEEIEQSAGISISEYFSKYGEEAFRIKEREILLRHLPESRCVISTGGGTACYSDNMDQMNRHGVTVFLDVPVETIISRITGSQGTRPLLKDIPEAGLPVYIGRHLEQRREYYGKAAITLKGVDVDLKLLINLLSNCNDPHE